MGADTDVDNACIDIILHQWHSIPEYLYKRSISMHIKVNHRNNFFLLRFLTKKHDFKTINDSVSVLISCFIRYLLKISSER